MDFLPIVFLFVSGCLVAVIGFVIVILLASFIVRFIDVRMNGGIETIAAPVPNIPPQQAMAIITSHLAANDFPPQVFFNRIYASKGDGTLISKRVFDVTVLPMPPSGSKVVGQFYMQSLFPKYMRFTRYGYLGQMARHPCWKIKMEMFHKLGVSAEQVKAASTVQR